MSDGGEVAQAPSERLRLFVALELPVPIREALRDWQRLALRERAGVRPVSGEFLHVTLCFLGWRRAAEVRGISAACESVAAQSAARLSLGAPRWLPPRRPRVLAVELVDPTEALARMQASLSAVLAAGGWYEPEKRPYLPHVTAARVPRGGRTPEEALPPVPRLEFRGSRVTLFRSRLQRSAAAYEPLTTVCLR